MNANEQPQFDLWRAPLRVRCIPDDPANYDYAAWLQRVYRNTGSTKPFLLSGKRSATPPQVPVLPGRKDWCVESSDRRVLPVGQTRAWFIVCRFATRDQAAEYCHEWRAAETWLLQREKNAGPEPFIYANPINEKKRLMRKGFVRP